MGHRARGVRRAAAYVLWAFSTAAGAQSGTGSVTGSWHETGSFGYDETVTFTCRGTPVCAGQYSQRIRLENCSNHATFTGEFSLTGVNLAQTGSFGGTLTLRGPSPDDVVVRRPDGTCEYPNPPIATFGTPYSASYNAATAAGTFTITSFSINGSFTAAPAAPPPVFPMTVTSNITPVSATASAAIQFRPQDVGSTGGVFVFAVAPASRVKGGADPKAMQAGPARAAGKAGEKAESCVIAQLNPEGQLIAITGAQLQAFLSGTLSAQGASVPILNNTPTPNVAGATFYVGYGPTGATMLSSGVFRNAVLVPGSGACPMLPYATALWWNPAESGWGLNLNQQGATMFGTLFTYDAGRAPLWLVMSNGVMQPDGLTYTGDLFRTTGPAFNANPFTPIGPANVTKVGTMSVSFSEAGVGTLAYTVNGTEVRKTIQHQVYGSRVANCMPAADSRASLTNYQDLWWNPAESGWGINITHQDTTLFATLFTYDAGGQGLWLVMSAGTRQPDGSYAGELLRTSGPAYGTVPFTGVTATPVGTMSLRFTNGNNGTLTYTYSGATVTKAIQRQPFSTPASACS